MTLSYIFEDFSSTMLISFQCFEQQEKKKQVLAEMIKTELKLVRSNKLGIDVKAKSLMIKQTNKKKR